MFTCPNCKQETEYLNYDTGDIVENLKLDGQGQLVGSLNTNSDAWATCPNCQKEIDCIIL